MKTFAFLAALTLAVGCAGSGSSESVPGAQGDSNKLSMSFQESYADVSEDGRGNIVAELFALEGAEQLATLEYDADQANWYLAYAGDAESTAMNVDLGEPSLALAAQTVHDMWQSDALLRRGGDEAYACGTCHWPWCVGSRHCTIWFGKTTCSCGCC